MSPNISVLKGGLLKGDHVDTVLISGITIDEFLAKFTLKRWGFVGGGRSLET